MCPVQFDFIIFFLFSSPFVRTLIRPMSGPFSDPTVVVTRNRGSSVTQRRLSRACVRVGSEFFAKVCDGFQSSGTCGDCRPRETPVVWINGCLSSKTSPRNLVVGCRSTVSNFHRYVFDVPACPVPEFPTKFNGIHKSPDRGKGGTYIMFAYYFTLIPPPPFFFSLYFHPIYILLLLLLPSVAAESNTVPPPTPEWRSSTLKQNVNFTRIVHLDVRV